MAVNRRRAEPEAGAWGLRLLGGATLQGPGGPQRLARLAAALLAVLSLEGPQHRERMASLLWPDSGGATERANLRQLLRRLRTAHGVALVEREEDPLRLSPLLDVDVVRLAQWASDGRFAEVARMDGALLSGLDYDDCAELADWLRDKRRHLEELRQRARVEEAARLEREGAVHAALEWNQRVLDADPTHEDAWQRAMRLHLLLGDRAAALRAYDRCRLVLQRELDVVPSDETRRLARTLEGGLSPRAAHVPRHVPPSVLRPRKLAGRERVWARLEAAWNARQGVFISGGAGLGKSRLLTEFAASRRERTLLLEARPGDAAVPYALGVRWGRLVLAEKPGLALPPWARRELAHVLHELGEPAASSSPEVDRLRLFEAWLELARLAGRGLSAVVVDDLHASDSASIEVAAYLLGRVQELPELPRFLCALRPDALSPELHPIIDGMVKAGLAIQVELEPLATEEVGQLLGGVDVEGAPSLAGPLTRYTGGNPLFVVETLRGLLESGERLSPLPEVLPFPDKVAALLASHLERLSQPALQLARTLVVAGDVFSLELASEVLAVGPVALAGHWDELVTEGIVRGHGFTHDLYAEAVHRGLPPPIREWLRRRVDKVLASQAR